MSKKYKYQNDIESINCLGICCPPEELYEPNSLEAFRFVFDDPKHIRNHNVPGNITPQRVLTENDHEKCTLFGLSCFQKKDGAISFFNDVRKTIKKFDKIVGNNISTGIIDNEDGHVTKPQEYTHFDLFEFENCDLSQKFVPIEKIL